MEGSGHENGKARRRAALARAPWGFPVQIPGWRALEVKVRGLRAFQGGGWLVAKQ